MTNSNLRAKISVMGVSRIQKFRTTSNHCNADVCSRFYLRTQDNSGLTDPDVADLAGLQVSEGFLTSFEYKAVINHRLISKVY